MTEDDQKLRNDCITSTDTGAINGDDPNRSPWLVAAQKKHLIERGAPTTRMDAGRYLQRGIAEWYCDLIGEPFEWLDRTVQHETEKWIAATPDAMLKNVRRLLEIKLVSWNMAWEWGATFDEAPFRYQSQVVWERIATGADSVTLVARIGEAPPIGFTYFADPEFEAALIEKMRAFRERYILGDEMPPIDGSQGTGRALQQMHRHHRRPDIVTATGEQEQFLREYERLRIDRRAIEGRCDTLENWFKDQIGEHEGLRWIGGMGGKFTWRKTKDRTITEWESFARGMMNEYMPDEAERAKWMQFYTRIKEGDRRIRFDSALFKETAEEAA